MAKHHTSTECTQRHVVPNAAAMESSLRSTLNLSPFCQKCKGVCWHPGDQKATQEAALKMFGVIPNKCVKGEMSFDVQCPYA